MRSALIQSPETVCSEHLQGPEQDEMSQFRKEIASVDRLEVRLRFKVCLCEFLFQLRTVPGPGLPDERGQVIMYRSHAAALKVDEPQFAVLRHHDVAALEIPVHEMPAVARQQPVAQTVEILFQVGLAELHTGRLQEAVFEIIEVEHYRGAVEILYRKAFGEVHPRSSGVLECRQGLHRHAQKPPLIPGVFSASPACRHCVEKGSTAQILLQISHAVVTHGQYSGHRQSQFSEVPGHIQKCGILLLSGAYGGNAAASAPCNPEILPVAS